LPCRGLPEPAPAPALQKGAGRIPSVSPRALSIYSTTVGHQK
jgi:hypothetical protein